MQVLPSEVRAVLRAAFARARGLGLTLEEVDDALSPPPEPPPPVPAQEPVPGADVAKERGRRRG